MKTKLCTLLAIALMVFECSGQNRRSAPTKGAAATSNLLASGPRTFPDIIPPEFLLPVKYVNIQPDYFAPADNPRYLVTFLVQVPPRKKVSIAIYKDRVWQEHTLADNSANDQVMNFTWKYYAPDSVGQYTYTYLPRYILVQ